MEASVAKQKTKTIEEYAAAIYELWKRIDPMSRRTELDRIHEFIEGLRPEFIVPVQSTMPASVADAVKKARAVETVFSIGMDLSAYSILELRKMTRINSHFDSYNCKFSFNYILT